jgi:hypothetical protein
VSDREFSDIQIFQHSGKGIPLFMTGHKNCLQADYLLRPGPRLIKKKNLAGRGLTRVEKHWSRHFVPKNVGTGKHVINFASDKRFGFVIIGQTGSRLCAPTSIIHRASFRDLSVTGVLFLLRCICR